MDPAQANDPEDFYSLKKTAELLSVTTDTLLEWNDNNILKPTITPYGNVGYRREQIEKFLKIQNLINPENSSVISNSVSKQILHNNVTSNINIIQAPYHPKNTKAQNKPDVQIKSNVITLKTRYIFVLLFISIASVAMAAYIANNKIDRVTQTRQLSLKNATEDLSAIKTNNVDANNFENSDLSVSENQEFNNLNNGFVALKAIFNNSVLTNEEKSDQSKNQSVEKAEAIGTITTDQILLSEDNFIPSRTSASRSNIKGSQSAPSGNDKDLTALLLTDKTYPNLIRNNITIDKNYSGLIIFLIFTGTLSLLLVLRRDNKYLTANYPNSPISSLNIDTNNQAILGIKQKTDGTVVINFRGNEYKLSRPELNSESDQFIERLISLGKDKKEISYDILNDENLNLNAPLSKLVTRLGFVGLKRDLFFPRTSKTSVFFRKYLTDQDLASMNISPDTIEKDLASN